MKPWWKQRQEEKAQKRKEQGERAKERKAQKQAEYEAMSDEEKAKVDEYNEKKKLVSTINSRMKKTVDNLGINQREYSKFLGRIQASSTLETRKSYTMDLILDKKGKFKKDFAFGKYDGYNKEEVVYELLSQSEEDIQKYSLEELRRLEKGTKTWSDVKAGFIQSQEAGADYSDKEMRRVMTIRHLVSQAMEANSDLWYELLDETGWTGDEARQKSTEEIYQQLIKQRAIELPYGRHNYNLLDNGDEQAHQAYLQFKNARKIQSEMGNIDTNGNVQKVHYEKW